MWVCVFAKLNVQLFYIFIAKEIQASDGSNLPKRTRGVQSSILSAMALKEKRATLSEAKDIRKVTEKCLTYAN